MLLDLILAQPNNAPDAEDEEEMDEEAEDSPDTVTNDEDNWWAVIRQKAPRTAALVADSSRRPGRRLHP